MLTSPLAITVSVEFVWRESGWLTRQEQQLASRRQPVGQIAHDFRIRRRAHNHSRTAHLRQSLGMILLARVHIHMRTQVFGELFLTARARERDDLVAHFVRVL